MDYKEDWEIMNYQKIPKGDTVMTPKSQGIKMVHSLGR